MFSTRTIGERKLAVRNQVIDCDSKEVSPTIVSILDAYDGGDTLAPLVLNGNVQSPIYRNLAIHYPAVYRCAAVIAGTLATCDLYVKDPDGKPVSDRPGLTQFPGARKARRLMRLMEQSFNSGNETTFSLVETIGLDLCLDGNSFLTIEKDIMGNVSRLILASSRGASITSDGMDDNRGRYMYYLHTPEKGEQTPFLLEDVIHLANCRMLSRYGTNVNYRNLFGIAPAMAIAQEIDTGMKSNRFVQDYFTRGVGGQLFFETERPLTPEQNKQIEHRLRSSNMGRNRHSPVVLGGGMTANIVQAEPQTADLKELRDQQVDEVARAYGVPPPLVGQNITQWGTGLEHLYRMFMKYCFRNYSERISSGFTMRLLDPGFKLTFDEYSLSRGDTQAIAALLKTADGIMTINEARRLAGLPNMEGGDKLLDRLVKKEAKENGEMKGGDEETD